MEDTFEVLDAVAEGANITADILADGKVTWDDALRNVPRAIRYISIVTAAIEGAENLKIEDLDDPAKRAEYVQRFRDKLDFEADETEVKIEDGVEILLKAVAFVRSILPKE